MKVVIIGAGAAGSQHAAAIATAPGGELTAVADVDPESATRLAAQYNVPAIPVDEAVTGGRGETVALCIPPGDRAELALSALHAGSAVVVEKPAALSIDELERIVAASDQTGLPVAVMHQHRMVLGPVWERLREPLADATATCRTSRRRTLAHYSDRKWRQNAALSGGGVLAHLGVHYLDLACQVLGGQPVAVHGTFAMDHRDLPDIDTRSVLTAEFSSGALLVASATTHAVQTEDHLVVEASGLRLEVRSGTLSIEIDGKETVVPAPPNVGLRAAVYSEVKAALETSATKLPISDVRRCGAVVRILEEVSR
ncbi:Gfo/Idh/MocA family protein [Glycomyces buryatensis]|nr:Gfo/Idh/MocA family oxidoreductase [Glycomyces buryatensis]